VNTVAEHFDILVRRARLRGPGRSHVSIGVRDGRIAALGAHIEGSAPIEIDAEERLVTESFVNTHLHLCKVWSLDLVDGATFEAYHGQGMGNAMTAISMAAEVKRKYGEEDIVPKARRAAALAAMHGNLHIRALADVDSIAGLAGVRALLRVREEFRGIVDLQVVAFAQDGIVKDPGTGALMRQAMVLGADVVGGIPWIEYSDADALEHVRVCFDLAQEFDKDISMLLDDAGDAGLRTLEIMALEAIRRGWEGRCLAHHCRAMALYPTPYLNRLAGTLRRARVPVVSDPHTGPLHARVKELLAHGLTVSLGQDDISDAYYPFGRNNMLEVAFLASHLLWMTTRAEMEQLYDMVTVAAARSINVADFGLKVGAPAHLVVLDAEDVLEALRHHAPPRHVVSHGRLVDTVAMSALARVC
jgi:cytosine deaminase